MTDNRDYSQISAEIAAVRNKLNAMNPHGPWRGFGLDEYRDWSAAQQTDRAKLKKRLADLQAAQSALLHVR